MSDDSYVVAMLFEAACFKSNAAQQEYTNALTLARPIFPYVPVAGCANADGFNQLFLVLVVA